MNIIGTGLSGLVGSRVVELLSSTLTFENLNVRDQGDITNRTIISEQMHRSAAQWVFHFAAKTDVDGAEKERSMGEKSPTWIVNVLGTEAIIDACEKTGKRLLYISTDYVFDGTKQFYTEDDAPHPVGWYATTKCEGEKRVLAMGNRGLVIRIANPYRASFARKSDFVRSIIDRLEKGDAVTAPSDQIFVPTFIDDIAVAIRALINANADGIYHIVGSQELSPFVAAGKIAESFGYDTRRIIPTSFSLYFADRAPRPKQAALKHDKITKLGVRIRSFDEGLTEMKRQLS